MKAFLRSVFSRGRLEREMQEEMAEHLEQATVRLMERGLSRRQARTAALREFGNVGYVQEKAREARGGRWIGNLWADVRFATRQFRRRPLASATAIAILALGLGLNVGVMTFAHSMLALPPPGIPPDEGLVRVRGLEFDSTPQGAPNNRPFSYPEVSDLAQESGVFDQVAAWDRDLVSLERPGAGTDPSSATAHFVTSNFFSTLGVAPILGVGLPETRETGLGDSEALVVLGHSTWESRFGSDPDVVGESLRVNGVEATVVGVAPPRFRGPDTRGELWLPLAARPAISGGSTSAFASYDSLSLSVVARVRSGVTSERATAAARSVAERVATRLAPQEDERVTADVVPLRSGNEQPTWLRARVIETAGVAALTLLVLAITCTHVAALLAAAALSRRREIAVRLALGASRARVLRQLLTESVLRALAGGALGALIVWVLIRTVGVRVPEIQLALPWWAAAFTFAVAVATGVLVGLTPALHASRLGTEQVLRDAAATAVTSRSRLQRGLLVAQVALTQPVLTGVVAFLLMVGGEWRGLGSADINDRIVQLRFSASAGDLAPEEEETLLRRLEDRFAQAPGVVAVVPQNGSPDFGTLFIGRVSVHPEDAVPGTSPTGALPVRLHQAPPGFFDLMGINVVLGRGFLPEDGSGSAAEATVISQEVARELWGEASPLGRRLTRLNPLTGDPLGDYVIVGVVDETHAALSYSGNGIPLYRPPRDRITSLLLVRTEVPAAALIPTLREMAREEAPRLAVTTARTLSEISVERRDLVWQLSSVAGAGGLLALLLSAVGLYGVGATAVSQRVREIGVRTAIGASRVRIGALFFGNGVKLGLLGVAIGLPAGLLVVRVVGAELGTPKLPLGAAAGLTAVGVMLVVAIASWLPALQAAAVNPQEALRLD